MPLSTTSSCIFLSLIFSKAIKRKEMPLDASKNYKGSGRHRFKNDEQKQKQELNEWLNRSVKNFLNKKLKNKSYSAPSRKELPSCKTVFL